MTRPVPDDELLRIWPADEPAPPLTRPDPCRLDVDVLSPNVCDYCGRPLHEHRAA